MAVPLLFSSSNRSSNRAIFFCFSLFFYFSAERKNKTAKPVFSRLCGYSARRLMVEISGIEPLTS